MSNKIVLKNMMFYGFHGVHEYEREQGQRFYVDVEIVADLRQACTNDQVQDTIDYTMIYAQVKEVMENHRFHLLEAATAHIAEHILATTQASEVTVAVRKPAVPLPGQLDYVQVESTRSK